MLGESLDISIQSENNYFMTILIGLGAHTIKDRIQILCPQQENGDNNHEIIKNGRDTSVKEMSQQYLCKTCGKSFYAHTSKLFGDLKLELKNIVYSVLKGGRIKIKPLARRLQLDNSTISRFIGSILKNIASTMKGYKHFLKKRRRSYALFVDETFITIHKKTWYLILAISGNNKVMAIKLVERRNKDEILEIVRDCEKRLLYGLQILLTDGFMVYKGVALEIGHNLIHVRHIHKPPYGRIEIDTYTYDEKEVRITTARTTNEITKVNEYFIARITEKRKAVKGGKKRGRKAGGKNRPKDVIQAEKKRKLQEKIKQGRPKGSKNSPTRGEIHIFFHDKKRGCVETAGQSSQVVTATLNKILKQFPDMWITTNLVEKEFSGLKKLLCFRGRRNVELWLNLITAYFAIRDEPKILKKALNSIEISSKMVNLAMPALLTSEICV